LVHVKDGTMLNTFSS